MNLPEDVAAILRAALTEADHLSGYDDRQAFAVLAEAVSNLLTPQDQGVCYCGSPEAYHRPGLMEHSYSRRPEPGDPTTRPLSYDDLSDLPF